MQLPDISPITNSRNVKLFERIPSNLIINKYKDDYNIDVKRFFKAEYVEVYKCLDTGFLFYYPYSLAGDEKLYEELQKHNGYYSTWNWEHQVVYDIIRKDNKVLEVGCGIGNFLQKLEENNIECCGLELNNEAVKLCTQKKLTVFNELLENHVQTHSNVYDIVCSFQVLEHISEPRSFIESCINAAKVGGKIIFGVPNNNPYIFKRDKYHTLNLPPHHMGLWSVEAFQNLPKFFNIKTLDVRIEELFNKGYYLNTFLHYNNLTVFKKVTNRLPKSALQLIASLRKWQGRNIVAIFEKYKI